MMYWLVLPFLSMKEYVDNTQGDARPRRVVAVAVLAEPFPGAARPLRHQAAAGGASQPGRAGGEEAAICVL